MKHKTFAWFCVIYQRLDEDENYSKNSRVAMDAALSASTWNLPRVFLDSFVSEREILRAPLGNVNAPLVFP